MTTQQRRTLDYAIASAKRTTKRGAAYDAYERVKQIVVALNLNADEYEQAMRDVAAALGV